MAIWNAFYEPHVLARSAVAGVAAGFLLPGDVAVFALDGQLVVHRVLDVFSRSGSASLRRATPPSVRTGSCPSPTSVGWSRTPVSLPARFHALARGLTIALRLALGHRPHDAVRRDLPRRAAPSPRASPGIRSGLTRSSPPSPARRSSSTGFPTAPRRAGALPRSLQYPAPFGQRPEVRVFEMRPPTDFVALDLRGGS